MRNDEVLQKVEEIVYDVHDYEEKESMDWTHY